MFFQRKAYQALMTWKRQSEGKRAMLIEGARRVGKSTLAQEFAQREYAKHLIIDFSEASEDIKDLFRHYRANVDDFFMYLQAYTGVSLPRRNAVIVFDEVQRFPPAREFIKQLVADGRYDYIETGSLISLKRNVEGIVIPSEESSLRLNPLDFEEFLWARGEETLASAIRDSFDRLRPMPEPLHRNGMVDVVKRDILSLYRNDIAQFGAADAMRIRRVFSTLPGQLARHDKKFNLASLDNSARSREYADAFFWLADACISVTAYNVDDPEVGLASSANESSFKCYMADTGLLITQMFADNASTPHEVYRDILLGKLETNEGMFTENIVAQQLMAGGHGLYFYSKRDSNNHENTMEIDFLISRGYDDAAGRLRISPIEVKSGKRYSTRSLDKFTEKFGKRVGTRIVLHPLPLKAENHTLRLPLYMAHLL